MINVFQPSLGDAELAAVAEVFASNWLGSGPRTKDFEAAFARHTGTDPHHMILITSATAGLFLAAELLDLGPGDDVVMPSVSFVAAGNAVAATGARLVFCDVDPRTLNPTAAQVEGALTPATRAVLLLHYGGYPGEIAEIATLCRSRGITLIEDAACAVASSVDGTACGTFGDIGVWSFDSMKVLVTGDGGMLWVRDPELAVRARRMAYHGLAQESGMSAARVSSRWWDLDVREYGRRIIGNDVMAAIGTVQLGRLPDFVDRRRAVAEMYDRLLSDLDDVTLPPPLPDGHATSYYFYWIQLPPAVRDAVAKDLLDAGIYTTFRYPPLHKVPAYEGRGILPGAERASERTLLLPLHQGLRDDDVRTVTDALGRAVRARLAAIGG